MDNKISLRGLFGTMIISALILVILRLAIVSRGENAIDALAAAIAVPLATFFFFGLVYLMILPFGIMAKAFEESAEPAISPFANDRLPEQLISVDNRVSEHQ